MPRLLQEYPRTTDGLSRAERRLLQLADGGIALWKAFPRRRDGERAHYVSDGSLADMAETLATASPPPLTQEVPETGKGHILEGVVALTDAGRAVLAGQLDRVAGCRVDRWLGGVHLQGRGPLWGWDDAAQCVDV